MDSKKPNPTGFYGNQYVDSDGKHRPRPYINIQQPKSSSMSDESMVAAKAKESSTQR